MGLSNDAELDETLDPMPLLRLILAVVTAFPPDALGVRQIHQSTLRGLFIAEQIYNLVLPVA